MPTKNLISPSMRGIDAKKNPLLLPDGFAAGATNMKFDEGLAATRPGFEHLKLGISGKFQGFCRFLPSRGMSFKPFAPAIDSVAIAADHAIHLYPAGAQCAHKICNPVSYEGVVHLYQAENYLVAQSPNEDTTWYEGGLCFVRSPGIGAKPELVNECICEVEATEKELLGAPNYCCYDRIRYTEFNAIPKESEGDEPSPHDTFIWSKHRNFLINGAGVGTYVHGRIHQEGPHSIYVSDIIHGRGHLRTDDILLMEEQVLPSMAPPLSTNSALGNLVAMAPMPKQGSANGDGDLIAYYDGGVVSFDTFQFPRETRHDGEGKRISEGWDTKRMVSHLLNAISAVGRYAVTILPRDHLFRSRFGLHFLKVSLGEGSFNDETTNTISAPVDPILDADAPDALYGAATGHWMKGSRLFATAGLMVAPAHTATSMAKGFVSFNKASTFTLDRTPIPVWEGVWIPNVEIAGVHAFTESGDSFGFLASTTSADIHFVAIRQGTRCDLLSGKPIPIAWDLTTKAVAPAGLDHTAAISNGSIDLVADSGVTVMVEGRSAEHEGWVQWVILRPTCSDGGTSMSTIPLGPPPKELKNATWIQLRLTGTGYAEIHRLDLTFSEGTSKTDGRKGCSQLAERNNVDHFRLAKLSY